MKHDIAEYVAMCSEWQKDRAEHQRPAGLIPPQEISVGKWDEVSMNFITGLPKTSTGFDSIWVVVDRRTESTHFIPVKTTYTKDMLADLFVTRIKCPHGLPKKIISSQDIKFEPAFWGKLHEALGTYLDFDTTYQPQMSGLMTQTDLVLEDMLRACAHDLRTAWDKCLPYAEFTFNNSYPQE